MRPLSAEIANIHHHSYSVRKTTKNKATTLIKQGWRKGRDTPKQSEENIIFALSMHQIVLNKYPVQQKGAYNFVLHTICRGFANNKGVQRT